MPASFSEFISTLTALIERGGPDTLDFNRLALSLFELQFNNVDAFQRFCLAQGKTPSTVKRWEDVPAVPTSAFKEFELTSLTSDDRPTCFFSSGTTKQNRSRHFHNAESLRLYHLSSMQWFETAVSERFPVRRLRFLTPPAELTPNSSLNRMFSFMAGASGVDATFFGELSRAGDWCIPANTVRKLREQAVPVMLLGTAFSFVHLLDLLNGETLVLPPGSVVFETGGYKGRSREVPKLELYTWIERSLAVPQDHIICEYGMSELNSQAYDQISLSGARSFQFPPWARASVISPETSKLVAVGDTGLLRIDDLVNVRSVAAIQTEDLAIRKENGFELLGRAALSEPRGCSLMLSS